MDSNNEEVGSNIEEVIVGSDCLLTFNYYYILIIMSLLISEDILSLKVIGCNYFLKLYYYIILLSISDLLS